MTSSWYRKNIWYFKGSKEYTRSGFEYASSRFNASDLDVEASHNNIVITGGSSTVGFEICLAVARHGCRIHIVDTDQILLENARRSIISETGNDKIHLHHVDLSSPREVTVWAAKFVQDHSTVPCDVLIHSMDYSCPEKIVDHHGIERTFACNVLAMHIVTVTLLSLLEKSTRGGRVVTVSSSLMLTVRVDSSNVTLQRMEPYDSALAYAQTKRQQVSLNLLYAQRFPRVKFSCTHPGWVDTPCFRSTTPDIHEALKSNLRTPAQGADCAVWLSLSDEAMKHPSGYFFQDRYPANPHLPLAWTHSSMKDEQALIDQLDELLVKFSITHTESDAPTSLFNPTLQSNIIFDTETHSPIHAPKWIENEDNFQKGLNTVPFPGYAETWKTSDNVEPNSSYYWDITPDTEVGSLPYTKGPSSYLIDWSSTLDESETDEFVNGDMVDNFEKSLTSLESSQTDVKIGVNGLTNSHTDVNGLEKWNERPSINCLPDDAISHNSISYKCDERDLEDGLEIKKYSGERKDKHPRSRSISECDNTNGSCNNNGKVLSLREFESINLEE